MYQSWSLVRCGHKWITRYGIVALICSLGAFPVNPLPSLTEGSASSRVAVVVYEDLQCPDCAVFQSMLDSEVLPKYGRKIKVLHKDFPLAWHSWARKAAITSRVLSLQGIPLALKYRRYVLMSQANITDQSFADYQNAFAQLHDLRVKELAGAVGDGRFEAAVQADCVEGVLAHVMHTPTVLVGTKRFVEAVTFQELSAAIDEALARNR